jgi:peptidoglycan/LPS O-acetylase OafA/YrhL
VAAGASPRDRNIDVLRALAALGVVATHARWLGDSLTGNAFESTIWKGARLTVFLFFAVSGYLIAGPFLRALLEGGSLPDVPRYSLRRVARIFPAYWFALTALLMLGLANTPPAVSLKGVVTHYLLVHSEVPPEPGSIYPIAWTLGVEATFYLAVPLIAVAVRRMVGRPLGHRSALMGIGVLALGSAALQLATYTRDIPTSGWATVVQYSLPAQFLFFAPGMMFAVWEHRRVQVAGRALPQVSDAALWPLGAGVTALWLGSMYLFAQTTTNPGLSSLGFALASGLSLALARCRRQTTSVLGRGLAWVGLVSYGLYLWHWIVMHAIFVWHGRMFAGSGFPGWVASTALLLAASIPLAAASWYWIERPAIGIASGLAGRMRTPAVESTG